MAQDLNSQLQIHQQINAAIKARSKLLKAQSAQITGQAKLAKNMCQAMACKDLDDLEDRLKSVNQELKQASQNAEEASENMEDMADSAERSSGGMSGLTGKLAGLGAAFGGVSGGIKAFKGFFAVLKGAGKLLGAVLGGIFKIGKAIIGIPFGILNGLVGMAQEGGGGPSPIREELENIREQFGSLASNEGKALASTARTSRKEFKSLGVEGVSFGKIFGYGAGGVAAAMKATGELSKALGGSFSSLKDVVAKNAMALTIYRKALGFTAEQQATMLKLAKARGKSAIDEQTAFASMAINMGKQFGVNAKVVAKSMAEMTADVSNFGGLSRKELASTAVYANKLGMEMKDLQGVIDGFDNFQDAAKNSAMLSQAFGMNIDSMKMMKAQSPAERIDMLRKSFFATGKSIENMTRQERKLLESQTKLSGTALEAAFGNKNMGLSYEDISSGAEDAEKKQLTQAEAMKELSDSIKKTFKGGSSSFKGFFDAFSKGFSKGIKRSKVFRQLMRNIRKSLKVIYRAGIRVGKAFVNFFPGVKKLLGGFRDLFDPKKFKKLANGMVGAFTQLFKDMQHDPKGGVKVFFARMKKVFKRFFASNGPAVDAIKSGGTVFLKALSELAAGLIRELKPLIAAGLNFIADFIKDPSAAMEAGRAAGGFMYEIFEPIFEAITENEDPNNPSSISGAFKRLFTTIWDKIGTPVYKMIVAFGKKYIIRALIFIVGKALIGAMIGAVAGGIGVWLSKLTGAMPGTTNINQGAATNLHDTLIKLAEISIADAKKLVILLPLLAIGVGIGLVALGAAVYGIAKMMSGLSAEEIVKALATVYVISKAVESTAQVMMGLAHIQKDDLIKGGIAVAAAGGIVLALGALSVLVLMAFEGVSAKLENVGIMLVTIAAVLAATAIVAAGAVAIAKIPGADPKTVAKGALAIGAAGLVVVALGALAAWASSSAEGVSEENVKKFIKVVEVTTILSIVTATAALALGAIMVLAGPIAIGIMAAGLVAIGVAAAGIGAIAYLFIETFGNMDGGKLTRANTAADVTLKVVQAIALGIATALKSGFAHLLGSILSVFGGSSPIEKGLDAMLGFMMKLGMMMPEMIASLIKSVSGADPKQAELAIKILEKTMKTLEPLIKVQQGAVVLAGTMANNKIPASQIAKVFKRMTEFVAGPLEEVTKIIEKINEVASGMDESDIKAATAMGQVLGSAATFVDAMTKPVIALIKACVMTYKISEDEGEDVSEGSIFSLGSFTAAMDAMGEVMPGMISSMGKSIGQVIDAINERPLSDVDAENMKKFATSVGPMAGAIGNLVDSVLKTANMLGLDLKKLGKKGTWGKIGNDIHHATEVMDVILFGGPHLKDGWETGPGGKQFAKGKHPGIIGSLLNMAKSISEVPAMKDLNATSMKAKGEAIATAARAMQGFIKVIGSTKGLFGKMPKDVAKDPEKRRQWYKDLGQFITDMTTTLKDSMSTVITKVIELMDKTMPANASDKQIKRAQKRMQVFKGIFMAMDPFVTLISSLSLIFKESGNLPPLAGNEQDIAKYGENTARAMGFIKGITEALVGDPTDPTKPGALSQIADLFFGGAGATGILDRISDAQVKTVTKKMAALTAAFGVVGAVSKVVTELGPLMGGNLGGEAGRVFEGELIPATQLGQTLEDIVTAFGNPGGYRLTNLFNAIIGGMKHANKVPIIKGLEKKMDSVKEVAGLASAEEFADAVNMTTKIDEIKAFYIKAAPAFEEMNNAMNKAQKVFNTKFLNKKEEEVSATVANILTLNGLLTGNPMTTGYSAAAEAVFSGGTLTVEHKVPHQWNTKLNVQVNIDSKELASETAKVKFWAKGGDRQITSRVPGATQSIPPGEYLNPM